MGCLVLRFFTLLLLEFKLCHPTRSNRLLANTPHRRYVANLLVVCWERIWELCQPFHPQITVKNPCLLSLLCCLRMLPLLFVKYNYLLHLFVEGCHRFVKVLHHDGEGHLLCLFLGCFWFDMVEEFYFCSIQFFREPPKFVGWDKIL